MAHHDRMAEDDAQRMTGQPINSNQSSWLDHWKLSTAAVFRPKDAVFGPEQLMTPGNGKCPGKDNSTVSTSFQSDKQLGSPIVLHRLKNECHPAQHFVHQQGDICQLGSVSASKEHLRGVRVCSTSTFSVHGKKTGEPLAVRKLETRVPDQGHDHPLLHDPSTHVNLLQNVVGVEKVINHSSIKMLPNREHNSGARKVDELDQRYLSLPKITSSFHGVGTSGRTLSPQVHQLWFTRMTKPKMYEVRDVYGESTISARFNGEMVSEFLCLSPKFSSHKKQEAKLQAFGSPTDDVATGNVNHSLVSMNESSAETDIMELDAFKKGRMSGVAFGLSKQNNIKVQQSSSRKTALSYTGGISDKMKNSKRPAINVKFSGSPALTSSISDREHGASQTQSLDAEHLFAPAEQATTSKGAGVCNSYSGQGSSGTWIKRLKLGTLDTVVHGTKRSEISEASSHEKAGMMFSRIMKQKVSSSEPLSCPSDSKADVAPDHATLLKVNSSSTGLGNGCGEITLTHFWIQRWCSNRVASSEKVTQARLSSEQQSSKSMLNDIEKKASPSIRAMALMGKALTGFHRCEIRRTGSLMVWNT